METKRQRMDGSRLEAQSSVEELVEEDWIAGDCWSRIAGKTEWSVEVACT